MDLLIHPISFLFSVMIMLGYLIFSTMVAFDKKHITQNATLLLRICVVLCGQGACLVILSLLQSLINVQTIQSTSVISTILFSYYLGADSFASAI